MPASLHVSLWFFGASLPDWLTFPGEPRKTLALHWVTYRGRVTNAPPPAYTCPPRPLSRRFPSCLIRMGLWTIRTTLEGEKIWYLLFVFHLDSTQGARPPTTCLPITNICLHHLRFYRLYRKHGHDNVSSGETIQSHHFD